MRAQVRELLGDIRGRAFWVVLGCLVCQMGPGFGYGAGALAPGILEELGWSRARLSAAQLPQGVMVSLGSVFVGFAVVRWGTRAVLSCGAVALVVGYALFAAIESWWHLAAAWAVVGFGAACLGDITVGAVVAQWVERSRGLALGVVYTGSNIGGFLATRGMVALEGAWSWRIGVASAALCSLAVLLPVAWLAVRDRATPADGASDAVKVEAYDASDADLDLAAALRTRSFWIVGFALLGFWALLFTVLNHLALTLVDGGMSRQDAGACLANAVAMGLVSKVAYGWIADRMSAKAALLLDYGLLTLAAGLLVALARDARPLLAWSFALIFGFSYAARDIVTPLILVHSFGSRYLAKIYGALMVTLLPGSNLGAIVSGWTHDRAGTYVPAYAALAIWTALSLGLLIAVRDERAGRRSPGAPR